LIVGGILLVMGLLVGLNMYRLSQKDEIQVKVSPVLEDRIEASIFASGKVTVPGREELYSLNGGIVQAVSVRLGEIVSAGQVLVEMDNLELGLSVRQAEANLAATRANLLRAREATGPADIAQAENVLAQAQAHLDDIIQRQERTQYLYDQGVVSQQEYEAVLLEAQLKQAQYESAAKQVETARRSAQASLESLEAQVLQNEIALAVAQNQLNRATITASQAGQVLQLEVEKGKHITPGKLIAVVGDTQQLEVKAELSEADAAEVQVGQAVEITADTLNRTRYSGEVSEVSPQAIIKTSSQGEQTLVPIIIVVKGLTELRPGYNVDLHIITGSVETALLIPFEALLETMEQTEVFVVQEGVVKRREVTTGLSDDLRVQILSGLAKGESVVLNPSDELKEGTLVKAAVSPQGEEAKKDKG
jgi:HlyD family secretion protein